MWAEGKEKEWTDCVAYGRRVFSITGDWNTAALDPLGLGTGSEGLGAFCLFFKHNMRMGLQVYGGVGEGRGKRRSKSGRGRERPKRQTRLLKSCTWGNRRKLETFQSRVDWTDPRTPEATLAAPIGKLENLNPERKRVRFCRWCKCEAVMIWGEHRMARG